MHELGRQIIRSTDQSIHSNNIKSMAPDRSSVEYNHVLCGFAIRTLRLVICKTDFAPSTAATAAAFRPSISKAKYRLCCSSVSLTKQRPAVWQKKMLGSWKSAPEDNLDRNRRGMESKWLGLGVHPINKCARAAWAPWFRLNSPLSENLSPSKTLEAPVTDAILTQHLFDFCHEYSQVNHGVTEWMD